MAKYQTPGVYIQEVNAFPNSIVQVETAIPAFIGYTYKADLNGASVLGKSTRITSLAEYEEIFGGSHQAKFKLQATDDSNLAHSFKLGAQDVMISHETNNELYFYQSIALFYANGGNICYILSVGLYGEDGAKEVKLADFMSSKSHPNGPLEILERAFEPTLIVIPDIIKLGAAAYPLYEKVLAHCGKMKKCFGIFDLKKHENLSTITEVRQEFREGIGNEFLNYGAAYYPWLNTETEIDLNFENLPSDLQSFLEPAHTTIFVNYAVELAKLKSDEVEFKADEIKINEILKDIVNLKKNFHQSLKANSPFYDSILTEAKKLYNQLPPSAAIAGLYTLVDQTRGVWKAPANYSLSNVISPTVVVSNEVQDKFNIDPIAGKSINVIRTFVGVGVLVWGARTLAGNDVDWKYINVKRTMMMIEQSIRLAAASFVFETNTANTWATAIAMISNFLHNLWKEGALAGATPEQAYDVKVGLGITMTAQDILEGRMNISVLVAMLRPSEFQVIIIKQQMQQS